MSIAKAQYLKSILTALKTASCEIECLEINQFQEDLIAVETRERLPFPLPPTPQDSDYFCIKSLQEALDTTTSRLEDEIGQILHDEFPIE